MGVCWTGTKGEKRARVCKSVCVCIEFQSTAAQHCLSQAGALFEDAVHLFEPSNPLSSLQ